MAFAFLVVMMLATLPSPLDGPYRTRDHMSAFTITVVFAIFAVWKDLPGLQHVAEPVSR